MTCERPVDSPGCLPQLWSSRAFGQAGMGCLLGTFIVVVRGAGGCLQGPGVVSSADRAMPSACPGHREASDRRS
jgi:hypothetical protein